MKTAQENIITLASRILLLIAGIALTISIFVPLWRIDLDAPQYPEGLFLLIYPHKLAGNVDIINGLNHYIGMKTLHTDDFIEFTVLPYIIGFFALATFLTAAIGRKKILYTLLILFILFGILAMIDFWRWEYNYGHNLDPSAAIIVPGMAYQPPLIGFKQLLNFGAYSMPSYGGWLFVASGVLMVAATVIETKFLNRFKKAKSAKVILFLSASFSVVSCSDFSARPIKLNVDNCDYCKMTIADGRFAAELITQKGRVYKFDDISCMIGYVKENKSAEVKAYYVSEYSSENTLIDIKVAHLVKSEDFRSPMRGNIAAFEDIEGLKRTTENMNSVRVIWDDLIR